MNNRANIMYFIEHLCDMAQRENHLDFVRMMQRDILRVVDAVAPSDGSGAANVKVVRRVRFLPFPPKTNKKKTPPHPNTNHARRQVLAGLAQKSVLLPDTVLEIEAGLAERDDLTKDPHSALSPVSPNSQHHPPPDAGTAAAAAAHHPPAKRLDKRQIEQRIEEDRERHKRLRESIWAVGEDGDGEFERLWDEASEIGEDDWGVAEEDAVERRVAGEVG